MSTDQNDHRDAANRSLLEDYKYSDNNDGDKQQRMYTNNDSNGDSNGNGNGNDNDNDNGISNGNDNDNDDVEAAKAGAGESTNPFDDDSVRPYLPKSNQSVDQVLNHIGWGPFQVRMFRLCCVGAMGDALEVASVAVLAPVWKDEWDLESNEVALISSLCFAGMFCGAIIGGYVSDKYGRLPLFQYSLLVSTIFGVLSVASSNFWLFAFSRFGVGLGYGSNILADVALYVEFLPAKNRGYYFMWIEAVWGAASFTGIALTWLLEPVFGWRVPMLVFLLPTSLIFFWRQNTRESARFYHYNGRTEEANDVLREVARVNGLPNLHVDLQPVKRRRRGGHRTGRGNGEDNGYGNGDSGIVGQREGDEGEEELNACSEVCDMEYQYLLVPLAMIWGLFNLANSIGFWLPSYAYELGGGKEDDGDVDAQIAHSFQLAIVLECLKSLVIGSMIYMITRVDRLQILRVSLLMSSMGLVFMGFSTKVYVLFFVAASFYSFSKDLSAIILYTYTPEVFPTRVRATAMGICQGAYRGSHIIGPLLISVLKDISFPFMCFIMAMFMGTGALFATLFLQYETRNRNIKERENTATNKTK